MAELLQTTPQNITLHLNAIYRDTELDQAATSKDYLLVQQEGVGWMRRSDKHYSLDAILAVGYRVCSPHGRELTLSPGTTYIHFRGARRFGGLPSFRGPRSGVGLRVSGTPDDGLLRLP